MPYNVEASEGDELTISVALTESFWFITISFLGESGNPHPSAANSRRFLFLSASILVNELTRAYSISALNTSIMQNAYL